MGIVGNIFSGKKQGLHPRDPGLVPFFGFQPTASGELVDAESSKKISAVLACLRVLGETMGSLPLIVYRRIPRGKVRDIRHPLYNLLKNQPNPWQTAFEFTEMMIQHTLLRGNAYAQKVSTNRAAIEALIPLHPDRVEPILINERNDIPDIIYRYTPLDGPTRIFLRDEIYHWKVFSSDGVKGESIITHSAETLGLSLASDKYGARFFKNDTINGGVLQYPGSFKTKEDRNRFLESWQLAKTGSATHSTAVLEQGMEFKQLGLTNKDSQFLELRSFQVNDVARIFRVPPHKIGDLEKATFSNIEQQEIGFVTDSIMPWAIRIEQNILRDLLTPAQRETHFAEFLLTSLLRGDSKARADYYKALFAVGALSPNDIRRLENMNPVAGGDKYFVPMNMVALEDAGNIPDNTRNLIKTSVMHENDSFIDNLLLEINSNGGSNDN